MKEFIIYTVLRLALFLGSVGIVYGVWAAVAEEVPVLWVILIAFISSGLGSYFLLNRQREAFAQRVDLRAQQATSRFEERRAREDSD